MNAADSQLQTLLRKNRPSPSVPPRFQQNVWRRIEDADAPTRPATWLDALAALVLQPRYALATAAILVLAGAFMGALQGKHAARHAAQMNYLAAVAPLSAR